VVVLVLVEGLYAEEVADNGGIEGCGWKSRYRLYRKPNVAGTILSKRESSKSRGVSRACRSEGGTTGEEATIREVGRRRGCDTIKLWRQHGANAVNIGRMNNTYMTYMTMKIFTLRLGLARAEHATARANATRMLMSRGRREVPARCECDQPGSEAGLLVGGEGGGAAKEVGGSTGMGGVGMRMGSGVYIGVKVEVRVGVEVRLEFVLRKVGMCVLRWHFRLVYDGLVFGTHGQGCGCPRMQDGAAGRSIGGFGRHRDGGRGGSGSCGVRRRGSRIGGRGSGHGVDRGNRGNRAKGGR
jgi:hypothetical protein